MFVKENLNKQRRNNSVVVGKKKRGYGRMQSSQKMLLIGGLVIAIVIVGFLLMQKPVVDSVSPGESPSAAESSTPFVGQAIGGFGAGEVVAPAVAAGAVGINPATANAIVNSVDNQGAEAVIGQPFTIEVIANPSNPNFDTFNKMEVTVQYDATKLRLGNRRLPRPSARFPCPNQDDRDAIGECQVVRMNGGPSDVPNANGAESTVTYIRENAGTHPAMMAQETSLLEITFTPLEAAIGDTTEIKVTDVFIYPPGPDVRADATNAVTIAQGAEPTAQIAIKKKLYLDDDDDGFGDDSGNEFTLTDDKVANLAIGQDNYVSDKRDCSDSAQV